MPFLTFKEIRVTMDNNGRHVMCQPCHCIERLVSINCRCLQPIPVIWVPYVWGTFLAFCIFPSTTFSCSICITSTASSDRQRGFQRLRYAVSWGKEGHYVRPRRIKQSCKLQGTSFFTSNPLFSNILLFLMQWLGQRKKMSLNPLVWCNNTSLKRAGFAVTTSCSMESAP